MAKSPFAKAHTEKYELSQKTQKKILRIYKQSAKDMGKRLSELKMVNPSDSLKQVYLKNTLEDLNKSIDIMGRVVKNEITSASIQSGQIAVDAQNAFMKNAGLTLRGAYSYIPREQVSLITSGKLYGKGWGLSKAIWNTDKKTKADLEKIVAKGLAENKPIKNIANDLERYVKPEAKKPWDWSKVYPGTAEKVDYNAQRLARTMIQHAYQTSLVQSMMYNPFCKGVIWYSAGIHGRTCGICLDRDGRIFPLRDLPLDHPNGLCYFEPALDELNAIGDRLANWANGTEDEALDMYAARAFNFSPKTRSGRSAIQTAKQSVSRTTKARVTSSASKVPGSTATQAAAQAEKEAAKKAAKAERARARRAAKKAPKQEAFDPKVWIDGVKANTQSQMLKSEKAWVKKVLDKEYQSIKTYSGSEFKSINGYLREKCSGTLKSIDDELERITKNATDGLSKFKLKDDIYLRRGTDVGDLAGLFMKGDFEANKRKLQKLLRSLQEDEKKVKLQNLFGLSEEDEKLQKLFGGSLEEKSIMEEFNGLFKNATGEYAGFTSTSSLWDRGFDGSVEVILKVPKGAKGSSIMKISKYGVKEGEFLLAPNTKVRCLAIEKSDHHQGSSLRVFLEVIL